MSNTSERDQVIALLRKYERSMSWLAKSLNVNRQSVQQWLVDGVEPRDKRMWDKMRAKILGMSSLGDLDKPRIPVGFSTITMRYAGEVPCSSHWGEPLSSQEYAEVDAQFDHQNRFAAKVVGDSCYPALHPGDTTIWHKDMNPPYGLIVLAQRKGDHGCTVKVLEYDENAARPRLLPVNPSAGEPEDGDGWGVIARLVGVSRQTDGLKRTWLLETGIRPKHMS